MPVIYEPKGRALEYSYLACNLYDGCVHGCDYCYVPNSPYNEDRESFHSHADPKPKIIQQIRREARRLAGTDKRVLLCFTCDPYPPDDNTITREALKIFKKYDVPFQVLTKGGMRAVRDFSLYGPRDAFAVTLTTTKRNISLNREPQADLPEERKQALQRAKDKGLTTWVSLEPVLDPEESLQLIRDTWPYVDLYKIGKMNHKGSDVDWRDFGIKAIELCEHYDKPYYIKHDLAFFLGGVEFHNTDTRLAEKSSGTGQGNALLF